MSKENKIMIWLVLAYYVLNIAATYFISTELLNRYITTFSREFLNEITSILGNIAALSIFLVIGLFALPRKKWFAIYLVLISFGLNVVLFAINFFTRNYRAMFSRFNFALGNNPDAGFVNTMVMDAIMELLWYYRIVLFVPFFVLLALVIIYRKTITSNPIGIPIIKKMIFTFSAMLISALTILNFQVKVKDNWLFRAETPMYGVQTAGLYNYYLAEFIFGMDYRVRFEQEDMEKAKKELAKFNKNKDAYLNFVDGLNYSNTDFQTGIWKDKNIYIIQLESYQNFVINATINGNEVTPYFNQLIQRDDVFYFDNVYTAVGMGNTADAEFAFHTGFYPIGDNTIHWDFATSRFSIPTITNLLPDTYSKYSFNNVVENFYNHKDVHENLFGYDRFRGVESLEEEYPYDIYPEKYLAYDASKWVSDQFGLYWGIEKRLADNRSNSIVFNMTVTPHAPFVNMKDFYPEGEYENIAWGESTGKDSEALYYYLDQIHHNDKILYDFLTDAMDENSPYYLENTVFILYGDHGNSIPKSNYEELLGHELSDFEYRRMLLNIPVIIIDPSLATTNSISLSGLTKADFSHQVKSQTDLFRTVINALGIEDVAYYGVNIFSGEPSYAYDPKNVEVYFDDFSYNHKDKSFELLNDSAYFNEEYINNLVLYKRYQDIYLTLLINLND